MSKVDDEPQQRMEIEDHDDIISDDDSEYTYVTDDDEEEEDESVMKHNKKGWFSFLRRDGHDDDDCEDEDYESDEGEIEGSSDHESVVSEHRIEDSNAGITPSADTTTTAATPQQQQQQQEDDHSTSSSSSEEEEDILDQIDNYNPSSTNNNNKQEEEDDESILMAQAIQRVQQRIQSHGGNIYNALEMKDQVLVDTLRGVEDENVIREVVGRAMEEEELEMVVDRNEEVDVKGDIIVNGDVDHDDDFQVESLEMEEDQETTATKQPFIQHGVYVEESQLVATNGNSNGVDNGNNDVKMMESKGYDDEDHQQQDEEDDEGTDEDEEEGPTLEEQRSLLSLAAEHDRVDVIKELLSISQNEDVNTSLLCGFTSADEHDELNNNNNNNYEQDDASESTNVIFVPPPLHAAVAHGSVNAASCLLRMGADPSIRPIVPTPYLSRNYQPSSPTNTRGKRRPSSMEEDRNYKKYHEMSAWELAFGSIVVLEDDGDVDGITNGEMEVDEEEKVVEKRGWFGFGGGHKKEEEDQDEDVTIQQQQDANGKHRIVRRRQPLNIAPNKLEGIRHAFTAEALRAIGADEVDRLKQLLDSGMDSDMEVAGKSLVSWAIEMEADGCCELLRVDEINANDKVSPPVDSDESSPVTKSSNDVDQTQPSTKPPAANVDQPPIPSIHDERLASLSPKDILTLIQENENLIPALTTCRDDLAEETSACQNILRDVQASGGRGGLSSQSLLDLVHSLKEKRRDLEEGVKNWQHAWEEREDELDFFWEEVLNDEWREHLAQSGILDNVTDTATMMAGYESTASLDDLTRRFCEVDNRVNTLRSSIVSLADECARYQAEVERAGMSGALSLTKSLREELKEMESQLSEAKSGEAMCRRKIELIQERLTNSARDESVEENVPDNGHVDAEEYRYEGKEDVSNVTQDFAKKELLEGTAYAEAFVHRGMERECNVLDQYEGDDRSASTEGASNHESYYDHDKSIENDFVVDEDEEHSDFVVVNDTDEVTDEAHETILVEDQEEAEVVDDDDVTIPSEMQEQIDPMIDAGHMDNAQSNKIEINEIENGCADHKGEEHADSQGVTNALVRPPDSELDALQPSDALKSGMSTAIVLRQPTGHSGSFSLQIWDLIRRIVGLGGRTPTPSYHAQSESSTNIMIV
ncbi:hypothetical protein QTG54_010951 [Skeletonema marinoi]|uniref:Uncharacterized protein n=1 Tax=Skeletonema marinoi TaxID=267567 RepID=A0AAD9D8S4_9STRA|nr:hypothetical protein QTG54_010951 [Skeletonema marinoi]